MEPRQTKRNGDFFEIEFPQRHQERNRPERENRHQDIMVIIYPNGVKLQVPMSMELEKVQRLIHIDDVQR